ncbi:putative uncharacterized protein K02A2.6-like [Daphnia sinensis]|uniref:CCHC-type domain-containing protein n=1 Tax=Daphnia sinensis TaxID=1820382 RepID=A0AAD5KZ69_9CRUS|nr:putative uncharacterized protein K02A2.6-like [Daphnia sinensis]
MQAAALPSYEAFSISLDKTTLSARWVEWIEGFTDLLNILGYTDDGKKVSALNYYGGGELKKLVKTLKVNPQPAVAADPAQNRAAVAAESLFDATVRTISAHFCPNDHQIYNTYVFRQAKQATDESLDGFHMRLTTLALGCGFTDVDREILIQIITGCSDRKIREIGLSKSGLSLSDLLHRGRTLELTKVQATNIEDRSTEAVMDGPNESKVYKVGQRGTGTSKRGEQFGRKNASPRNACQYCAKADHEKLSDCPARGKECSYCGKPNHFAAACYTKQKEKKGHSRRNKSSGSNGGLKKDVRQCDRNRLWVRQLGQSVSLQNSWWQGLVSVRLPNTLQPQDKFHR